MKNATIVFKGTVKNEKLIFDYPHLYYKKVISLEGKRFEMVLNKEEKNKTRSQFGYYFGGIIEATCLQSSEFEGWTKDEVHQYLISTLRSYPKQIIYADGRREIVRFVESIEDYTLDQFSLYIDDVIKFLSVHHGISVLSPEDYKYEKYHKFIEPFKNEEF